MTNALFRDATAFGHFVVAIDTTQSTDTNRVKLYVNGVQVTDTSSANWPAEDQVFRGFAYASGTTTQVIGTDVNHSSTSSRNEAGFILGGDAIWVDGSALAPTAFGEVNSNTGTGLGTFLGKTLLERKSANVSFLKSDKLGGATVRIIWKVKDLKSNA